MLFDYFQSKGFTVQRKRVRDSIQKVDSEGNAERWSTAVHR